MQNAKATTKSNLNLFAKSPSPAKRWRSASPGDASTASKRHRPDSTTSKALDTSSITIVSWNTDTPAPYITKTSASQGKPISSYFTKSPNNKAGKGNGATTAKPEANVAPSLRQIFAAHGWPDIVCLQEVRALSKDREAIAALRNSVNPPGFSAPSSHSSSEEEEDAPPADGGPTYSAHFCFCQSSSGSKRFGVATYVSSVLMAKHPTLHTRTVKWDHEGRLLLLFLPSIHLCIINVYALNGSTYAYKDPLTGVSQGTRNERKREFNRLLMAEAAELQKQGWRLVMLGDWNISREARDCFPRLRTEEPHALARKEFNEVFMPTLDVVDIFREMHGDKRSYSWFSTTKPDRTDCARVDYALLSRSLVVYPKQMEYLEEPKWRYKSDHAPMRLVVDCTSLASRM